MKENNVLSRFFAELLSHGVFSGFGELPEYVAIVFSFSDAQFVYKAIVMCKIIGQ